MSVVDQDILRVSMNFELADGTQYQNIYHCIRDGVDVYSVQDHLDAINAKMTAAYGDIKTMVSSGITEQLCFVDRVEFNEIVDEWRVVENIGTFTPVWAPTGGIDGVPYQCSPYIYFKTLRPRTVGKKFLFPPDEDVQDDGILTGGALTLIAQMATEILSGIVLGGDATLTFGVPRTGVSSWYNFLVAVVQDVLGTQRRRKPGVGA